MSATTAGMIRGARTARADARRQIVEVIHLRRAKARERLAMKEDSLRWWARLAKVAENASDADRYDALLHGDDPVGRIVASDWAEALNLVCEINDLAREVEEC